MYRHPLPSCVTLCAVLQPRRIIICQCRRLNKRRAQEAGVAVRHLTSRGNGGRWMVIGIRGGDEGGRHQGLSLIHISEPTRPEPI
eukprot:7729080-Pyramimonas_sp.AAC.1